MNRIDTYLFKVYWYNDYDEQLHVSYGVIGASSYANATEKITQRFHDVIYLSIYKMDFMDGFYFLAEEEYKKNLKDDVDMKDVEEEEYDKIALSNISTLE